MNPYDYRKDEYGRYVVTYDGCDVFVLSQLEDTVKWQVDILNTAFYEGFKAGSMAL